MKHKLANWREQLAMAIAWRMPRWLVKWCVVRAAAHATTGKYGAQETPSVTVVETLQRWPAAN